MNNISKVILGISVVLFCACGQKTDDPHDHEVEETTLSYTVWTDKTELFVEFKPLVVGELISFAAHFSEMENFKAITEGKVTVSLIKGKSGIRNTVDAPTSPGIFRPSLEPNEVGIYDLIFEIETPTIGDKIVLENIEVYATKEEAQKENPGEEENPNEISFLKEQAWKMEFANYPVIRDTVYDIIKTGGQILPAQGDEKTITATANGIVVYSSRSLIIGSEISKGQKLFAVVGGNISNDNVETQFSNAKSNYERAKSNFERKEKLYELKAIAKSEYEEALNEFELAKIEYFNLSRNFSKNGKSIKSSSSGYIKSLFKQEGEYVEAGEPLAVITQNKRLTIKADVAQLDYQRLNSSISANFLFNKKTYSIEEFNGRLLSYGKNVSGESPKIPVYFDLDNTGALLAGSFIEVWIKTNPQPKALKIPVSALLEDYGIYSVIVHTAGESFEKREVILGASDGLFVHIISGVKEGERVVTKGAYQVKMASMGGQVPAHGHAH